MLNSKQLPKPAELLETLHAFELFQGIDKEALEWLIDKSEYCLIEKGEVFFEKGTPIDYMHIVVAGEILVRVPRGKSMKEFGVTKTGAVTGVLPFSRMKIAGGEGSALTDVYILQLHRDYFIEMVNVSYPLTQALVAVMSTRIRDFSQLRFQDEKLMALGKLSAGLAHELNNPASAMVRSSEELYKRIHTSPEKFKAVLRISISPEQTDEVNNILFSKVQNLNKIDLSLMEREDQLDELLDWLEDHDVEDGDEVAETFVDFGFTTDDLAEMERILDGKDIAPITRWIESTLSLEKLVSEIRESADRISTLVKAVKGYSHMDRDNSMEPTDVRDGLRSTIIMLKFKMKLKQITIQKNFPEQLPKVSAVVGELNQVWTNILANAIDALGPEGKLTIDAYQERDSICVEITDNGHGIPEDIQTRIFEPFFTTKSMDEGTGIGLDIVQKIIKKHNGSIDLTSVPGKTTFKVCIPVLN